MSLQLIAGNSGSGKSHYIYEKIVRESVEHLERHYLVIVPEQLTMQTEKELVSLHPRKGTLNIDVLSFNRLAYRIFEEVGGNIRSILEETGKSLVLQKVVWDRKKKLKVLGGTLRKPGSIAQMKSLISELLQYKVAPEDLKKWMPEQEGVRLLAWKLKDVKIVYKGFLDYLLERYLTVEEIPEVLCGVIGKSRLLKDSTVVFDEFTGFTPVQNQVISEMYRLCSQIYVVVTLDRREEEYRNDGPHRLFHMSHQMIRKLVDMAKKTGTEVLPMNWIVPVMHREFGRKWPMYFLEQHLFRYDKHEFRKKQETISVWEAEAPAEELSYVSETILRLIREEGYCYKDFALVTGDLPSYGRVAESIFEAAGIPFFLDQNHPVLMNPLIEFIRSAIDMVVQNFSYESVFRYLRCGLTDFSKEETDELENYVLALGIRGWKQYGEDWVRVYRAMNSKKISSLNELRKRFRSGLEKFVMGMKERKSTVLRKTAVLYQLIVRNNVQKKLKLQEKNFYASGEVAMEKEYAQIYGIVMNLLDKLVEVLGRERMKINVYQKILEEGFQETQITLIPLGEDQVLVGDIECIRLKNIKVLFLVGINEGIIPKHVSKAGILSEVDREYLRSRSVEISPTAREEMYRQQFYLYLNLTKPSERLYLSYCKANAKGSALMPSYLIGVITRLFPEIKIRKLALERNMIDRLETSAGAMELFIEGFQNIRKGRADAGFLELYRWYQNDRSKDKQLEQLMQAAFYENPKTGIGHAVAKALYGEIQENSPTRLGQFAACAFAHFLKYGLKLQEREKYELNVADVGTVIHETLKKFSEKLAERGYQWTALTEKQRNSLVDKSLEEIVHDYRNTIFQSSSRNTYFITRIQNMMRCTIWALQEQIRKGAFEPGGFEISFDARENLDSINIDLSKDEKLKLCGRIDRMDRYETTGKIYVKIIDYKTGSATLDLLDLYYGMQLQMAVYLNVALELEQKKHPEKEVEPAGIYYYHIQDPFVTVESVEAEKDQEEILNAFKMDGLTRNDGEILPLMDCTLSLGVQSSVIPIGYNKNGSLTWYSKVVEKEDFEVIQRYTSRKIRQIGRKMMDGETTVSPFLMEKRNSCAYCPYHGICGFDERIPGFSYRRMSKLSQEKIMQLMREELREGDRGSGGNEDNPELGCGAKRNRERSR
ncbi:MAG: helicase-exonuclease AddAB subunit AddB [Lachnospiraceae bacterium]|nr:helicase-exonuclease AddAB subunit AddB [Lachnospiraceae bacterium]